MYAAGRVNPQPKPLKIRPTKTGVKENIPTIMQTHPVSSNIIPSLSVHKQPIFSITDPLNNVPIMIVKDNTLTVRTKGRIVKSVQLNYKSERKTNDFDNLVFKEIT